MRRIAIMPLLFILTTFSFAQESMSYAEQLQALEEELDSMSIFNLIDSLFSAELLPKNELNIRFAFTSNVTSAGRDYDLNQNGISAGLAYYHTSGVYGDLSGYWNSGIEPNYNPTILSAGYLGDFKSPKWSYSLDAERWFYNPQDSSQNQLKYALGGSLNYDFKWGFTSVDYSFLFGNETAHRIINNLSGNIRLGKWWIFENVNLFPSVNMMMGNSNVTQQRITNQQVSSQIANRIEQISTFSNLNAEQRRFLTLLIRRAATDEVISEQQRNQLLFRLRNGSELSIENQATLRSIVEEGFETTEYVDSNEFGILNYSFNLPLSLTIDPFSFLLSFSYSIPIQLPGEFIELEPFGYFGVSISYRIPAK